MLNIMSKKIFTILAKIFCLSKPMIKVKCIFVYQFLILCTVKYVETYAFLFQQSLNDLVEKISDAKPWFIK